MNDRELRQRAGLALLLALAPSCARRPPPAAPLAAAYFDYVYVAPAAGTTFELTASSEGVGTVTRNQGEHLTGPIVPEKIVQTTALQCAETVLTTDASGPSSIEVTCRRGETKDGGESETWVTHAPVQIARAADDVVVSPATLSAQLQLKYKRLFGPSLFSPPWAVMLAGGAGARFTGDRETPLALDGAGLFLGETTMLTLTKATARLRSLTADTAELDFHAVSTQPYDGTFTGTLTIERTTGWLVASSITATIRGADAQTGFVLELALRSNMSRTHKRPAAAQP